MLLKYGALSLFGTVSAITISSTSASLPMLLKAILLTLFICMAVVHLLRIINYFELSRYLVEDLLIVLVYFGLAVSTSGVIDRLSYVSKDLLIATGAALLIFLFVERGVQSYVSSVSEPFFHLAQFISDKISKILPKKTADIHEQDEQLNAEDYRVSAIHESGHALLYGVLDYVPESLTAFVNKRSHQFTHSSQITIGGRVFANQEPRSHQYQSFAEWSMLCDLAGQESERVLLGESSLGARGDMEHWYYLARMYLKSGCSELLYFPQPESDWEERENRKSLEIMLDKQRKILSHFFKENLQVLKDLADTLSQRERLKAAELKPFLEKVVTTPGMPNVSKEYSPHV
jgi:hypothetical protein